MIRRHYNNATETAIDVVIRLLRRLSIPFTVAHVRKRLLSHPDFPGILSLAETLPEWGVRIECVRGSIRDLVTEECPGVLHLKGGQYAILESIKSDRIVLEDPKGKRLCLSQEKMDRIWSGIFLRVSRMEPFGEKDHRRHRREEILARAKKRFVIPGLPALLVLAFTGGLTNATPRGTLAALGIAHACGWILCAAMASSSFGRKDYLEELCPTTRRINCRRVLASPAGSILGISMSEWGLMFFGGGFISLLAALFAHRLESDMLWIGLIGLAALPYTLFSVFYQAFVVRSWCWMCLIVQGILWGQLFLLLPHLRVGIETDFQAVTWPYSPFFGYGLSILVWLGLRNLLKSAAQSERWRYEAIRLRRDPDYIQTVIQQAGKISVDAFLPELEIGPSQAFPALVLVVNPLCSHCGHELEALDKLVEAGRGRIKAVVRFLLGPEGELQTEKEMATDREVCLRLLALARNVNRNSAVRALLAWHTDLKADPRVLLDSWKERFPSGPFDENGDIQTTLSRHCAWALNNGIVATPTAILNGRRLPPGFSIENLEVYLSRMYEE